MNRAIASVAVALALVLSASALWAATPGAFLGELSWPEAERRVNSTPVVVLPFAPAAKAHGPHLPMNADAKVADYLCARAVESQDVVVAPPIAHGWLPAFRQFPGTEVRDPTVFIRYVDEVARSLVRTGAHRLVFLNTSIAMTGGLPLSIVARDLREELGTPTLVVSWDDLETDEYRALQSQRQGGHADELETSINLFLQPELVDMEKAVTDYGRDRPKDYPGYRPGLFSRDAADPAYSETVVFGDARLATAEKGRRALAILTAQWLKALAGFSGEPLRAETKPTPPR